MPYFLLLLLLLLLLFLLLLQSSPSFNAHVLITQLTRGTQREVKLKVDASVLQRDSDNLARREEDRKQVRICGGCDVAVAVAVMLLLRWL
jgi:hypothetical protein